jgi:hypothetical protein
MLTKNLTLNLLLIFFLYLYIQKHDEGKNYPYWPAIEIKQISLQGNTSFGCLLI